MIDYATEIILALGLIHTRIFDAQYCNIAIKDIAIKKIFSSKYCSYISKSFQINIFNSHSEKNIGVKMSFLSQYLFLFITILCAKISRVHSVFRLTRKLFL